MLPRARSLKEPGLAVLLIDLQAHGESEDERISFGYREAAEVRAAPAGRRRGQPARRRASPPTPLIRIEKPAANRGPPAALDGVSAQPEARRRSKKFRSSAICRCSLRKACASVLGSGRLAGLRSRRWFVESLYTRAPKLGLDKTKRVGLASYCIQFLKSLQLILWRQVDEHLATGS
jgi:hypothetical protein